MSATNLQFETPPSTTYSQDITSKCPASVIEAKTKRAPQPKSTQDITPKTLANAIEAQKSKANFYQTYPAP